MADGRNHGLWSIASSVMALVANCHRDAKSHPDPYTPAGFDPFAISARKPDAIKVSLKDLRPMFGC